MSRADGDGHASDADGQRVFEQEPATVQRLYLGACLKPKATQAVRLGLAKACPINVGNVRNLIQWQFVELHPGPSFIQTQLQLIIIFQNGMPDDSGRRVTQPSKEAGHAEVAVSPTARPFGLGLFKPHDAVNPTRQKGPCVGPVFAVIVDENQQCRGIN